MNTDCCNKCYTCNPSSPFFFPPPPSISIFLFAFLCLRLKSSNLNSLQILICSSLPAIHYLLCFSVNSKYWLLWGQLICLFNELPLTYTEQIFQTISISKEQWSSRFFYYIPLLPEGCNKNTGQPNKKKRLNFHLSHQPSEQFSLHVITALKLLINSSRMTAKIPRLLVYCFQEKL